MYCGDVAGAGGGGNKVVVSARGQGVSGLESGDGRSRSQGVGRRLWVRGRVTLRARLAWLVWPIGC